ncbi:MULTISPECIES: DUF1217 domain-containing protein [unclassified Leisingera]|uniref:DUF1217 domain-containing protein n=1 Tax=unclassified Leisingera TaxID=2614906 RepID=UPI000312B087|nr:MULTISPECIES: DUF1217 domain-containing protein [unclassified Leisingera]KIC22119.1 flagellar protein [Leisingera sp. ANG-S3]KIC55137.1 flagellar protein [Leisingera sp. ANG-S]KID11076.1 flagellar protein [Leisingera sp. ANG1]
MSFTPYVFGTGIAGWTFLQRTQAQQQEVFEKSPILDRRVQDFTQRITSIQNSDQLLDDYNLLQVTLGAFGLDEDIGNRAFIQKVLDSDLSDSKSFVNRLNDSRYLALAQTFGFNSPDGPQLPSAKGGSEFAGITTADDLLSNQTLLKKALDNVGLKGMENNQFFLQKVLESDLSDPDSFANKLTDTRFADFAKQFEFGKPPEYGNSIQALVSEFNQHTEGLASADDLLEDEDLLQAVIETFDLERTNKDFLRRVLNSDTTDPDSFVNQLEDTRYLNVSRAFGFGYPDINAMTDPDELLQNPELLADALDQFNVSDRGETFLRQVLESDLSDPNSFVNQPDNIAYYDFADAFQNTWPEHVSKMQVFSDEITDKLDSLSSATELVFDLSLFEASLDIFGLSHRDSDFNVMIKTLDSDLSSEISYANLHHDNNMKAMAYAFSFNKGTEAQVYPDGFADEIADLYTTRQFEIAIGESDPNMRLALAFERELQAVVDEGGSENAHWYNIMGSPPLRTVFETALVLPSGFGQLDIERQLGEMKDRTQAAFGVTHPADLLEPDMLDQFRRRFLLMTDIGGF